MYRLTKIFKFFASLRLAIVLLVSIACAMSVGTFIESYHGSEAAKLVVYRTLWFGILLILLGLNLLASALDRMPWKKSHTGFLTTHLGIILILAGSLVSQAFGIEGQLAIEEGKSGGRMTLAEQPLIQMVPDAGDSKWTYSMRPHAFPWSGKEILVPESEVDVTLTLLTDYPKAKRTENISPGGEGLKPALHVKLEGSMASSEQWLILDDPKRAELSLGPAQIRFARSPIKKAQPVGTMGSLHFEFPGSETVDIPVSEERIGEKLSVGSTPYKITIRRVLKNAKIDGTQLIEESDRWDNPALQLVLEGKELTEYHTLFSRFPEFPTMHGLRPSKTGVSIRYEAPGFSQDGPRNELRFIYRPSEPPLFQVKHGEDLKEGEVKLNESVSTGWMDFEFTVDEYVEHAREERTYTPLPGASQNKSAMRVVQVEAQKDGDKKILWLEQGEIVPFSLGASEYHVLYGLRTKPLGFQIALHDFLMDKDPGTDRPASFKSQVTLKDVTRGLERDQLIQMNEPLKYKGFKVYQSAYQLGQGGPDTSIFAVARDPGNWIKYMGVIIMASGMLMLFFIKPLSTLKVSDPKLRKK